MRSIEIHLPLYYTTKYSGKHKLYLRRGRMKPKRQVIYYHDEKNEEYIFKKLHLSLIILFQEKQFKYFYTKDAK